MTMITGINRIFEHDGRKLHLQAEDLGDEVGAFEVRVYDEGTVLWLKRIAYGDLVEQQLPKEEFEKTLRMKMDKTIQTVQAAVAKGMIS